MVTRAFPISFAYRLDHGKIAIDLQAEVEAHSNPLYYVVRNIRSLHPGNAPAIPALSLTKKAAVWVHLDSQKPTALTLSIGEAIDAHEFH